jgi:hypothetical protein
MKQIDNYFSLSQAFQRARYSLPSTLIGLFVFWIVGCGFFGGMPSDKSMESNFRAHETDFKKLVSMFKEDANLDHINEAAAYLPSNEIKPPKAEIPPQRLDEYHRLFKQTGVKIMFRGDNRIFFGEWSEGGLDKSFMYAENPPSPLVDSREQMDKLPPDELGRTVGYKKIADNWYLRFRKFKKAQDSTDLGSSR